MTAQSRESVMIALLAIGFVANELIKPVAEKYYEPEVKA